MISANEAMQMSLESFSRKDALKDYLSRLDGYVTEAAGEGKFSCLVNKQSMLLGDEKGSLPFGKWKKMVQAPLGTIAESLEKELSDLGYTVNKEELANQNLSVFTLSWDGEQTEAQADDMTDETVDIDQEASSGEADSDDF